MAKVRLIALLITAAGLGACSMQPLIDASLPAPERPSTTPVAEPQVPAAPASVQTDERALTVAGTKALPAAAQHLVSKAQRLSDEGKPSAAVTQLERAAKIAPRAPLIYFELAQAYWQQLQAEQAKVFAEKALSLGPSKALGRDIRALLLRLP